MSAEVYSILLIGVLKAVHIEDRYTVFALGLTNGEGYVRVIAVRVSRLTYNIHKMRKDLYIVFILDIILERYEVYLTLTVVILVDYAVSVFINAYRLCSAKLTDCDLDALFKCDLGSVIEFCSLTYGRVTAYIKTDKVLSFTAFGECRLFIVSIREVEIRVRDHKRSAVCDVILQAAKK